MAWAKPSLVPTRWMPSTWAIVDRVAARWPPVDASARCRPRVEQNPAASPAPSAAATKPATIAARRSGVAVAVASSQWSTGATGAAGAKPANSGSAGRSAAAVSARWTSPARPVSSVRVVDARATRPSSATVSRTDTVSSLTFWWMRPLANRVSADAPADAVTTASPRPPRMARVRSHRSPTAGSTTGSTTAAR